MDSILSFHSIGISDLRESPARAFEQAGDEAVVVLNHNRPAGYIVSQALMTRIMDQLADRAVTEKARSRMASIGKARKITLDEL
jgi:antitoxin StbD